MIHEMSKNISVVITSFNQKAYLVEAIKSVINQTMRPFEIIIADDCSTDASQKVIKNFEDSYPNLIRAFYHKQNIGIPKNKNFALEQVRGELVTWVDGDDRFLPRKLETEFITLMKQNEAKIIYSNFYYIDQEGHRIGQWTDDGVLLSGYVFKEVFGLKRPMWLFRNELAYYRCLQENGFYDPCLDFYEDWDLRVRLTKRYHVAFQPEPLAEYRLHPLGISNSPTLKHIDTIKSIYQKNRNLLDNIPASDKAFVENGLTNYFALLCFNAAQREIARENNKDAFKYWLQHIRYRPKSLMNIRFIARIILSKSTRVRLKSAYQRLNE
jgi:glycosyltransferase involved in cell wall biosynthesis